MKSIVILITVSQYIVISNDKKASGHLKVTKKLKFKEKLLVKKQEALMATYRAPEYHVPSF